MMLNFYLEVVNSDVSIAAFALAAICIAYFGHEYLARPGQRWTKGMRIAMSILTICFGTVMTRLTIYLWRHVYGGGAFSDAQTVLLLVGCAITLAGFVWAIYEYSRPLYGNCPWITTLAAILLMTAYNVASHFGVL